MNILIYSGYASDKLTVTAVFDSDTKTVLLSGSGNGRLTVTVPELLSDKVNDEYMPIYFNVINASDGGWKHEFKLTAECPNGVYTVYVNDSDGNEAYDKFAYIASEDSGLISGINAALSDPQKLYNFVEENAPDIGIDSYSSLFEKSFEVCRFISDFGIKFDSLARFSSFYNGVSALINMQGKADTEIETLLLKYSADLGIDYDKFYVNDDRLNNKNKEEFLKILSEYEYTPSFIKSYSDSKNILFDILCDLKLLSVIRCADYWKTLKDIFELDFKQECEKFVDSVADYEKVKNKDSVFKLMTEHKFNTISDISKYLGKSVDELLKDRPSSSVGGSSGGGYLPEYEIESDQELQTKVSFCDLSENHWAYEYIIRFADMGILNGYDDGSVRPDNNITRAEFVKIAMDIYGVEPVDENSSETDTKIFDDVNSDDWYADCVQYAAAEGIVKGSNGNFYPHNNITREDASVIIYRMLGSMADKPKTALRFSDKSDISAYATEAVTSLYSMKIINGYEDNTFRPGLPIKRCEAVKILALMID